MVQSEYTSDDDGTLIDSEVVWLGNDAPRLAPMWGHRCLPTGAPNTSAAPPQDKLTTLIMTSSIEQSPFFQQRRSKDELVVKGQS